MKKQPGTFFTVPKSVISILPALQGSDIKVYLYLCDRVNGRTGKCYPSQSTIAKECKLGIRTVGAAVRKLEQLELIRVQRRDRGSNVYEVLYLRVGHPTGATTPMYRQSDDPDPDGNQLPHNVDWTGSLLPRDRQSTAANQEHSTRKEDTSFVSAEELARGEEQHQLRHIDAFRHWQDAYPRRGAPRDALQAFQRAISSLVHDHTVMDHPEITSDEDAVEFLIDRARAYADDMRDQDPRFILGPVRWLKDECYDCSDARSLITQPLLATNDELVNAGITVIDDYNN